MEIHVTIGVIVGIFGVLGLALTWGRKIVTRQDLENLEARLDAKMDARFAEFERKFEGKFEDFERKMLPRSLRNFLSNFAEVLKTESS